jgi:hypothetical protein
MIKRKWCRSPQSLKTCGRLWENESSNSQGVQHGGNEWPPTIPRSLNEEDFAVSELIVWPASVCLLWNQKSDKPLLTGPSLHTAWTTSCGRHYHQLSIRWMRYFELIWSLFTYDFLCFEALSPFSLRDVMLDWRSSCSNRWKTINRMWPLEIVFSTDMMLKKQSRRQGMWCRSPFKTSTNRTMMKVRASNVDNEHGFHYTVWFCTDFCEWNTPAGRQP